MLVRQIFWGVGAAALIVGLVSAAANSSSLEAVEESPISGSSLDNPTSGMTEAQSRSYSDLVVALACAGFGTDSDGSTVVRVYKGEDRLAVESAFAAEGLSPHIVSSLYSRLELKTAESRLRSIQLKQGEVLGFQYDPIRDVLAITGTVSAELLESAVGSDIPFEFVSTELAGRASGVITSGFSFRELA